MRNSSTAVLRLKTVASGRNLDDATEGALAAEIKILDPRCFRHLVLGGGLGAAEAYIRGYWTCNDLVSLARIFCQNAALSSGLEGGPARL